MATIVVIKSELHSLCVNLVAHNTSRSPDPTINSLVSWSLLKPLGNDYENKILLSWPGTRADGWDRWCNPTCQQCHHTFPFLGNSKILNHLVLRDSLIQFWSPGRISPRNTCPHWAPLQHGSVARIPHYHQQLHNSSVRILLTKSAVPKQSIRSVLNLAPNFEILFYRQSILYPKYVQPNYSVLIHNQQFKN